MKKSTSHKKVKKSKNCRRKKSKNSDQKVTKKSKSHFLTFSQCTLAGLVFTGRLSPSHESLSRVKWCLVEPVRGCCSMRLDGAEQIRVPLHI